MKNVINTNWANYFHYEDEKGKYFPLIFSCEKYLLPIFH